MAINAKTRRAAVLILLLSFCLSALLGGCAQKVLPANETGATASTSAAQATAEATTQTGDAARTDLTEEPRTDEPTASLPEATEQPTQAPTEPATTAATVTSLQTNGSAISLSALEHRTEDESAPAVYFTKEISSEALLNLYVMMMTTLPGKVAVKLTTGESQLTNYLKPELIGDLVRALDGTIIECMTAYGGVRSTAALSKQAAKDRGYTDVAPFDLLDEDGSYEIPFSGGSRINRAIAGSHIQQYDSVLVLSHFKGHLMAGFGGAIKNVGIGMSSKKGKIYVHSGGTRTVGTVINTNQDAFLEALAETVKAISDYMNGGENMLYISVMNRLSVDCDCMALPAAPDMHDIGVLASADPVALDQACVDLVYAAPDGGSLIQRMEALHGVHVLEHAEKIGLGSRSYRLVCID